MSLRLNVDIDNVSGNFQPFWAERWLQWFGTTVDPDQLNRWDAFRSVGLDADDFWKWTDVAKVWRDMPPVQGAQGALWNLQRKGHKIDFATSRHASIKPETLTWLLEHFGFLFVGGSYRSQIHFCGTDKSHLFGDLWLDDSPETLRQLVKAGKPAVKFSRPWNKPVSTPMTVRSWSEFETLVDRLDDPDFVGMEEVA